MTDRHDKVDENTEMPPLLDDSLPDMSVMDGFLAGIALSPAAIPPEEWMVAVWFGPDNEDGTIPIPPRSWLGKHLQGALDDTVARIRRGGYKIIEESPDPEQPNRSPWSGWVEGFADAVALNPEAWAAYKADPATRKAMLGLQILFGYEGVRDDPRADLPEDEVDAFARQVPANIGGWIASLAAKRLGAPLLAARSRVGGLTGPLIGRNAPCACGSGKKYKHCCGRQ